jgi:hypothetical protein
MEYLYHVPAQIGIQKKHNFDASFKASASSWNANSLAMPPIKNKELYSNWALFKKAKAAPITVKVFLLKAIIDSAGPVRCK